MKSQLLAVYENMRLCRINGVNTFWQARGITETEDIGRGLYLCGWQWLNSHWTTFDETKAVTCKQRMIAAGGKQVSY